MCQPAESTAREGRERRLRAFCHAFARVRCAYTEVAEWGRRGARAVDGVIERVGEADVDAAIPHGAANSVACTLRRCMRVYCVVHAAPTTRGRVGVCNLMRGRPINGMLSAQFSSAGAMNALD